MLTDVVKMQTETIVFKITLLLDIKIKNSNTLSS